MSKDYTDAELEDLRFALSHGIRVKPKEIKYMPVESAQSPPDSTTLPSDTIGIEDGLTPWVKRINAAVGYTGTDDAEDVRSILKKFVASQVAAEYKQLLAEMPENSTLTPWTSTGETYQAGFNSAIDQCRAIIQAKIKELADT